MLSPPREEEFDRREFLESDSTSKTLESSRNKPEESPFPEAMLANTMDTTTTTTTNRLADQDEGIITTSSLIQSAPDMMTPPPTPKHSPATFKKGTNYLEAIATCKTLRCIRDANRLDRDPEIFPFPLFIIIGFQKAATTSLYSHFTGHPQLLRPAVKEPEFFSFKCNWRPPYQCSEEDTEDYIRNTLRLEEYVGFGGKKAVFESSTHLVRAGERIAPRLIKFLPWMKIIIMIRDPISRAASMLIHLLDVKKEGCLTENDLGWCLVHDSQINGSLSGATTTNYSYPVGSWFEFWPADQIHVIQYEELIEEEHEAEELMRVKDFLGIKPDVPRAGLGLHNARRFSIRPDGWKMKREHYEKCIEIVRPDVIALLDILESNGNLKDRGAWMARWEKVWNDNLASCDESGNCNVLLS